MQFIFAIVRSPIEKFWPFEKEKKKKKISNRDFSFSYAKYNFSETTIPNEDKLTNCDTVTVHSTFIYEWNPDKYVYK